MIKFDLSDRFRLNLKWYTATYEQEGVCLLQGAYFSGPALSEAQQINDNDHIMIDFAGQYFIITNAVYVAKLSWKEAVYDKEGNVHLRGAMLTHETELNRVPKLKDSDFIIIDTSQHTVEQHHLNFNYKAYVVNRDTQLYKFGEK
jgi:hypothetical protein